jgi:HSP20 family protein
LSNPWWRRRKKKNPWFNDIYEELEKLGDLIDETVQKAFENSSEKTPVRRDRIQGFSIKIGPDGKPRIHEFNSRQPRQNEPEIGDEPEPLVDIIEERETLVVLAALPGVNKDDIGLRITENCLTVSIDAADFEWYEELKLPTGVDPKSARASYKNGVLEVKVNKLEKLIKDGRISVKK